MTAPKTASPLKLQKMKSPTELAMEHLQSAKQLGEQHIQLTENSLVNAISNLAEIEKGGVLFPGPLRDRAGKLRDYLQRELQGLQATQGWPKQPAATTAPA